MLIRIIKKRFEERPIWTRLALASEIDEQPSTFKEALNYLAYYYLSGPWKRCWVRFGYDARQGPLSKCFQIVDYRASFSSLLQQSVVKARYKPELCRICWNLQLEFISPQVLRKLGSLWPHSGEANADKLFATRRLAQPPGPPAHEGGNYTSEK
ncbi:hypothetical protein GJ496_001227 [Pomphorhynchus laevis]|nr:hypothetical protein GJ496_001227 [Pomphorhynchus laevis]